MRKGINLALWSEEMGNGNVVAGDKEGAMDLKSIVLAPVTRTGNDMRWEAKTRHV